MRLHVLGGGDEVGASMLLLESEAGNVVVDCGIRMGGGAASQTPDLAAVEGVDLDAILVTHAHLDHTGALPLLHAARPEVPVFCTAPTAALMRVLLLDAVKIMEDRLQREQELPLYPVEAVSALLGRINEVPLGGAVRFGEKERLAARVLPGGHILGAAMVELSGPGMSALVTGDISLADQHTVPGLAFPPQGSGLVVAESTYGGRMHSDRKAEENRFIAKAREVMAREGKLVVPAFALGRAQELLLILIRAMRREELPPVPVWADGMVRNVCQVYSRFEHNLPPFARKLSAKHGNPFFGVLENVRQVADQKQRDEILAGGPCIVIASSGMLTGGASVFYARRLAGGAENCIAITGYQDEEAPGRRLLELASGESDSLMIDNAAVAVKCEVAKYALSAHIDGFSLLQFVSRLAPDDVVWVHGDGGAREWLHENCRTGRSRLVRNGEVVEVSGKARAGLRQKRRLGGGEPLSPALAPLLAEALRREGAEARFFTRSQLLDRWYGVGGWDGETERACLSVLAESNHFEEEQRGKRTVYRLLPEAAALALAARSLGPAPPHLVGAAVERLFPPETGMYRAKQFHDEHRVSLCFNFPRKARQEHGALLAALEDETRWKVEVYPQPNLGVLLDKARDLVAAAAFVTKAGFAPETEVVKVKVTAPIDEGVQARLKGELAAETGYGLEVAVAGTTPGGPSPAVQAVAAGASAPMEINAAFQRVTGAFAGAPHRLLKKSRKADHVGAYIELRFVTPEAGANYLELMQRLSAETGWRLVVSPNNTPQELQRLAAEALPEGCTPVGEPKIYAAERRVQVRCVNQPDRGRMEEGAARFKELTGFGLDVTGA